MDGCAVHARKLQPASLSADLGAIELRAPESEPNCSKHSHSREASKARMLHREMLGKIRLAPGDDGSIWANYELNSTALLRQGAGFGGIGGPAFFPMCGAC